MVLHDMLRQNDKGGASYGALRINAPPSYGSVRTQGPPRHGYTFAYPELLLTSAQRVFVSHKSKYQLKLFVTTILAKLNVVQAEDARSRVHGHARMSDMCARNFVSRFRRAT